MDAPKLYLSHDADSDWLNALELGAVDDAQPPESWRGVDESFGYLCDGPDGREIGFKVLGFSCFDPEDPNLSAIWGEPRFDVPMLGLRDASPGEITLAARSRFDGRSSLNRRFFHAAMEAQGRKALELWLGCLESGDAMAHHALGYTYFELGRYSEAYRHLRHYTEIAPQGSWNWCWLGKAALAVGQRKEATYAFRRAIQLTGEGEDETDAPDLLKELGSASPVDRPREA